MRPDDGLGDRSGEGPDGRRGDGATGEGAGGEGAGGDREGGERAGGEWAGGERAGEERAGEERAGEEEAVGEEAAGELPPVEGIGYSLPSSSCSSKHSAPSALPPATLRSAMPADVRRIEDRGVLCGDRFDRAGDADTPASARGSVTSRVVRSELFGGDDVELLPPRRR